MSRHLMAKMRNHRIAVRDFDYGSDPHLPHDWEELNLVTRNNRIKRSVPHIFEWHPPHGESHVTYWIRQPVDGTDFGYSLKHEGLYQGKGDNGPSYRLEDDGSPLSVKEHELEKAGLGTFHLGLHDTLEDAKAAAGRHYERNYRSKAKPPADYYDNALNQVGDPDNGYDIFGEH